MDLVQVLQFREHWFFKKSSNQFTGNFVWKFGIFANNLKEMFLEPPIFSPVSNLSTRAGKCCELLETDI